MASTKPIAITISSTCAAFASNSHSPAAPPNRLLSSSPLGHVSFVLLQRWRGNNCPLLVQYCVTEQQVITPYQRIPHTSLFDDLQTLNHVF
jgi:hypothetical protein